MTPPHEAERDRALDDLRVLTLPQCAEVLGVSKGSLPIPSGERQQALPDNYTRRAQWQSMASGS